MPRYTVMQTVTYVKVIVADSVDQAIDMFSESEADEVVDGDIAVEVLED